MVDISLSEDTDCYFTDNRGSSIGRYRPADIIGEPTHIVQGETTTVTSGEAG